MSTPISFRRRTGAFVAVLAIGGIASLGAGCGEDDCVGNCVPGQEAVGGDDGGGGLGAGGTASGAADPGGGEPVGGSGGQPPAPASYSFVVFGDNQFATSSSPRIASTEGA